MQKISQPISFFTSQMIENELRWYRKFQSGCLKRLKKKGNYISSSRKHRSHTLATKSAIRMKTFARQSIYKYSRKYLINSSITLKREETHHTEESSLVRWCMHCTYVSRNLIQTMIHPSRRSRTEASWAGRQTGSAAPGMVRITAVYGWSCPVDV